MWLAAASVVLVLDRIELIDVVAGERRDAAPGPQIFRLDVGIGGEEFNVAPPPPTALMAPVRLAIRQLLTEPLEGATQPGGVDACRRAPRAFHAHPQVPGRVKF